MGLWNRLKKWNLSTENGMEYGNLAGSQSIEFLWNGLTNQNVRSSIE